MQMSQWFKVLSGIHQGNILDTLVFLMSNIDFPNYALHMLDQNINLLWWRC